MGITWEEFLLRYSKTLRRIQETYGVENPTLRFSLNDVEKFLSKNASKRLSNVFLFIYYFPMWFVCGRPPPGWPRGRSGGRHCTAGQYGYVPLERHLVYNQNVVQRLLLIFTVSFIHCIYFLCPLCMYSCCDMSTGIYTNIKCIWIWICICIWIWIWNFVRHARPIRRTAKLPAKVKCQLK